ncbi:class I mannose-6-phosphate isomerase [Novosphingobium sp.]|uniref:class I mannose-6-phosphate isomerase n=1 Tax=Novosphingobium sp. TaxID=1874826 RepID=UPI003B51E27B
MTVLPIREVEKPWGMDVLPAPFTAPAGTRIGEIWFERPVQLPSLLVKYIFTSEKLSVQVHPDDAQALAAGEADTGKEECWLVIAAEPGAALGIGFRQAIDRDAMRAAALDGAIEDLLVWHQVQPGDFFYIPANTVHAIGAGVSLIEIQQNSDITYRLYDYGRPRPLHLDAGIAVSNGTPHDAALRKHIPDHGTIELANGRYFQAHRIDGVPDAALCATYAGPILILPRTGTVRIGDDIVRPGDCAVADGLDPAAFADSGLAIVVRPAQ